MKRGIVCIFLIFSIFLLSSCGFKFKKIEYDLEKESITISEKKEIDFNPIGDPEFIDVDPIKLAENAGADSKVTALTELATVADDADIFYVIDDPGGTPTSKKITRANILGTNLLTFEDVTPSANGQSLIAAADYAAMRTLLDLEAGTDFYSKSAMDTDFPFSTFPTTPSAAPDADYEVANKKYVDDSITGEIGRAHV